jgi:histidinol-phosphate aminotransferase
LVEWARELPDHVVLVVDEAYGEYLDEISDWSPLIEEGRKVVILRTFSKIYGLAGIRVGYGRTTIELANLLQRVRQPFNVNLIGQVGALAALEDHAWVERCRRSNAEGLRQVTNALDLLGLRYLPSFGNFLLVEVGNGRAIYSELLRQGIIVRPVEIYQLPSWVRITIGSFEENDRLLRALKRWVEGRKSEIGD